MGSRIDLRSDPIRTLSRGRCFLYVAPCMHEDILKLGFARDPLVRLHSLHGRYYEFFDLEAGFLIQTDTVREARDLETSLKHQLADHNAPAPLTARWQAGGHTEWYRGAHDILTDRARALADTGFLHHPSLRAWLRERLIAQGADLYAWADAIVRTLPADDVIDRNALPEARTLTDVLDAYADFQIALEPLLSEDALNWYRRAC